ncbi:MAG TPA: hypothetical protein DEP84_20400 [Chloroflexi bacterium]|nr:hypothetical protein [Chloroflexota bacterium]
MNRPGTGRNRRAWYDQSRPNGAKNWRICGAWRSKRRIRERFQALDRIGSKHSNARAWAAEIGRDLDPVLRWVHRYNEPGPEALEDRRTGGRVPLLRRSRLRK